LGPFRQRPVTQASAPARDASLVLAQGEDANIDAGFGVTKSELVALIAITVAAALLRFAYVGSGGPWDSDQGTEMLAIWSAVTTGHLPLFGPAATSLGSTFHHGALYYDLLLPAAWLSRGDPRAILTEIAAANVAVVPMLWWVARSIGGRATGLIVALMAATSADLVFFSTFIWNPTFIEPGAALAVLGAWQAWRTRRPQWWLAAAAGLTVAAQAHVATVVLAIPLGAVFLLDLRRACASRRRVARWGAAGAGLFVLSYLPVILHELTSGFPELRGIASYLSSPPGYVSVSPVARLLFAAIRIPGWPLTGWPYFELHTGLLLAVIVAFAMAVACPLLLLRTWRHRLSISGGEVPAADERAGVALVCSGLAGIILALGLGLRAVSELNLTMTEQYHTAADPFVLVAAGIIIGVLWQARRWGRALLVGRVVAILLLIVFVGWNAVHWPPLNPVGSWLDAQAAATRIERDATGTQVSLVALYAPEGTDAYEYPLVRDGVTVVTTDRASTIVVLCDSARTKGCGGDAEEQWRREYPGGQTLTLIDRFEAAPQRILSVYKRTPEPAAVRAASWPRGRFVPSPTSAAPSG
jgi:hypothetical protein